MPDNTVSRQPNSPLSTSEHVDPTASVGPLSKVPSLKVSVPDQTLAELITPHVENVEFLIWDMTGPAPQTDIDLIVPPYMGAHNRLSQLSTVRSRLVQSQSIGYDGVQELLPSNVVYANAATVHETSTAELTLALILSSQRGIPDFVRAQEACEWKPARHRSLADSTVLLVGYGGVGKAIETRLIPFETTVVRVARTARHDEHGHIHSIDELPSLLPHADIVVVGVPLSQQTQHLVNADFLSRMPDSSLLVNIARGPVVDTQALLSELQNGRLRAALDVTDPEPLPAEHPLWKAPNTLISPHVGGASSAMTPRIVALIARQVKHLQRDETPENIVIGSAQ